MKETDLTLKTAFLQALVSGKCRSEIHAWQWENIALFPSDFIAKNQLAREGSQNVSLMTIPALTTIVDRQFKKARTLCPLWVLRYYLFVSNQRPERVSIPPFHLLQERTYLRLATLSSWLKQTILLCYKLADQQALDLVQANAHDIRAFAASKAFTVGYLWTKSCKPVTGKLTTHLQIFT